MFFNAVSLSDLCTSFVIHSFSRNNDFNSPLNSNLLIPSALHEISEKRKKNRELHAYWDGWGAKRSSVVSYSYTQPAQRKLHSLPIRFKAGWHSIFGRIINPEKIQFAPTITHCSVYTLSGLNLLNVIVLKLVCMKHN